MYETIFSLTKRPFLAAPRTDRYFAAAPIENARQTLARGIQRAEGPGLLIGPAGSGKSLICQLLAEQFAEQFNVVLLSSTRLCTPRALLQNILFELELPYRDLEEGELRLSLIDFLQRAERCPEGMLLVVDEANTLPLRLLEEIRMITNVVRDGVPRVRLVLAGGPQLEERFASPRLESLNQRIAARCYLQSMTREETGQYVLHQVGLAGGAGHALFPEDALRAVFNASDGVPRLVNQVCDHALMMAAAAGQQGLTPASIEEAWADLQQLPTPSLAVEHGTEADAAADAAEMIEFGQLDDEPEIVPSPEALTIQSSPVTASDPFGHQFEEEEIVLDRYAALDSSHLAAPPAVGPEQDEQETLVQHVLAEEMHVVEPCVDDSETIDFQPTTAFPQDDHACDGQVAELEEVESSVSPESEETVALVDEGHGEAEPTIHSIDEAVADATEVPEDDRDVIIIQEEGEQPAGDSNPSGVRVRRREYRHLFATLRQN